MSFSELELPQIFNIVVTGGVPGVEGQLLTDDKGRVTISPPNGIDETQKWVVSFGKDQNLIIQRPGDFNPLRRLSYDGAPDPKPGARVVLDIADAEWQGVDSNLRPVGSNLGIAVAPPTIFPPILNLSPDNQLQWKLVIPPPKE